MQNSYSKNKQIQNELGLWLIKGNYSLFGTIVLNRQIKPETFRRKLYEYHGRLDRKLLGSKYHKKPITWRTRFVALLEHLDTNLHAHMLIKPARNKQFRCQMQSPYIWEEICPGGDLKIDYINSKESLIKICRYSTKECWNERNFGKFIISDEFIQNAQ